MKKALAAERGDQALAPRFDQMRKLVWQSKRLHVTTETRHTAQPYSTEEWASST